MPAPVSGSQDSHMTAYSSLDAFLAGGSTPDTEGPSTEAKASEQVEAQAEETPADTATEGEQDEAAAEGEEAEDEPTEDLYEFKVTGPDGEKLLKFNLNDKDKIKKALPLAYAARDFQARANRAEDKLKAVEPKLADVQGKMDLLNKTWEERGEEGIIDLLGGKQGHFKDWIKAQYEKMRQYEDASPVERERLDTLEEATRLKRELDRERALRQKESERLAQEREEAETKSLENQLHPAFNKFRFAGKLGDASAEEFYDKALWRDTLERLEALPGSDLTPARVEEEFRRAYEKASKVISQKAAEKTKKVIETKKKEARQGAKVAVKKGLKAPTNEEKRMQDIKSGRWTDAILGSLGIK